MVSANYLATEDERGREEFGIWLRSKREERKLSRAELSRIADVSDMQIYRIENGETGSKRDTLRSLAKALGLDETDVLRRAGFFVRLSQEETTGEPTERLDSDFSEDHDDPLYIAYTAFYLGAPPDLRPALVGEVGRFVRDYLRLQTTHGRRTDAESDARTDELPPLRMNQLEALDGMRKMIEQMQCEIAQLKAEKAAEREDADET